MDNENLGTHRHRKVQRLKRFSQWTRETLVHTVGRCGDSDIWSVDKGNLGSIGRCGDSEIWSVDKGNLGTHRDSQRFSQ